MGDLREQRQYRLPRIRRAPSEGKPFAYCKWLDSENSMDADRNNLIARMAESHLLIFKRMNRFG
jgi:hypothetical protein